MNPSDFTDSVVSFSTAFRLPESASISRRKNKSAPPPIGLDLDQKREIADQKREIANQKEMRLHLERLDRALSREETRHERVRETAARNDDAQMAKGVRRMANDD